MSIVRLSSEDGPELMGRGKNPFQVLKEVKKMKPAQRKAWFKKLRPSQKLALAAVMPAILALIASNPVSATIATVKAAKKGKAILKAKGLDLKGLKIKIKRMTPAQRKAWWKRQPPPMKAFIIAAGPAILPLILGTAAAAAAIAPIALSTPGVKGIIAASIARKIKGKKVAQAERTKAARQAAKTVRVTVIPKSSTVSTESEAPETGDSGSGTLPVVSETPGTGETKKENPAKALAWAAFLPLLFL